MSGDIVEKIAGNQKKRQALNKIPRLLIPMAATH